MGDSLAIDGGVPILTEPYPQWPCWDKREEQALLDTLHSGNWWRVPGTEAKAFEAEFAAAHGAKHGIAVLNAPGTIDSDYRGEVQVILINLGNEDFIIKNGDRIAQLVIAPVTRARVETVSELSDTDRGAGGFGSTGR